MNAFQIAAAQLVDINVVPISLHYGTKKPTDDGWQNSKMPSRARLAEMFPDDEPHNLGALMGTPSGHVQGIDWDVYSAFSHWKGEYKPPDTRMIFTARGLRTIYRTEPEALRTSALTINNARVGEFLADGTQMVMPPSMLESGFEYTDNGLAVAFLPPDHPAFLALIKRAQIAQTDQARAELATGKRKPARFAQAALDGRIPTGKRYPTRSELDAAIIQSLARSGFDATEIYSMLDSANLRSHWHKRKEASRRAEIARIMDKFADTNSALCLEALKRADALASLRQSRQWAGFFDTGKVKIHKDTGEIKPVRVMATTVEAVLLAHETKVRDCLTYTYQLDTRAGDGRFTNMGRPAFERANRIAVAKGFITVAKKAKGTCATVYQVPDVATLETLAGCTSDTQKGSGSSHFNTAGAAGGQDGVEVATSSVLLQSGAFDYAGLGRTAFLVYRAALAAPMTTKALAELTGLNVKTVQRTVKQLARYGLVEKRPGRCWQSDANVNWSAVGDYLNTTIRVKEKQQQTRARREARAKSYKLHCVERARVVPDSELPATLNTPAKRAEVKAKNNVTRYGANTTGRKK